MIFALIALWVGIKTIDKFVENKKAQNPTMLKSEQINQWMSGDAEYNVLTPLKPQSIVK